MIEFIHYTAISSKGREHPAMIGVKDHDKKIAGHINRVYSPYITDKDIFNKAYQQWDEWTKDNRILFIYE